MRTCMSKVLTFLSFMIITATAFPGTDSPKKAVNPKITSLDLDPKYKELASMVMKARSSSEEAFKLEKLFSRDNPKGARVYSFSDPNVLNIVFHDFSCTNSSDTLYSLLTPELAEELASNTSAIMNSMFLVQAGRINERVSLFRKIITCFKEQKPSVYEQFNRALMDVWGETPVPVESGEVAQKRLELLKKVTSIIQKQKLGLDTMEFKDINGAVWKLDLKQQDKFRKYLEDFETNLNLFLPVQPRDVPQRSNSAGASNAKTGHVK